MVDKVPINRGVRMTHERVTCLHNDTEGHDVFIDIKNSRLLLVCLVCGEHIVYLLRRKKDGT